MKSSSRNLNIRERQKSYDKLRKETVELNHPSGTSDRRNRSYRRKSSAKVQTEKSKKSLATESVLKSSFISANSSAQACEDSKQDEPMVQSPTFPPEQIMSDTDEIEGPITL